ncbi:MAG: DnaJ domain-containing protein [Silvibacterium sp.]
MQIAMKKIDYYEFLQISPNAEEETIHRVYRFLAARFHPDNPASGNSEMFSMLTTAYEVLSNPARRAQYDASREKELPHAVPLSYSIDFMDQMEGEMNRRLAVLAVLYFKRRANPNAPEVSLAEIELRMGFPRDYLDFTTWYLRKKGYITRADNSDFTLTAQGVDFVETQRVNIPILNKLLTPGTEPSAADSTQAIEGVGAFPNSVIVLPDVARPPERRLGSGDRRANPRDRRSNNPDRRANPVERRSKATDRRSKD